MKLLVVCLLLATLIGFSVGIVLPLLQPLICWRNEPNISACVLQGVEAVLPQVIYGDYGGGLHGPTLEPYRFELDVNASNGFQVTVRDGYVTNVQYLKVTRLRVSLAKRIACMTIKLPALEITGQYILKMKLGDLLDINGSGSFHVVDDPTLKVVYPLVENPANLFPVQVKIIFDHPVLNLTGLFPGQPGMDEFANTLINQNPFFLLDQLTPELELQIRNTFNTIVNILLQGATFDELFPV